jgi:hypothetical protein
MLKLPINNFLTIFSSVSTYIREQVQSLYSITLAPEQPNDLKLLSFITSDLYLGSCNILGACTVEYKIITISGKSVIRYYVCLIDLLGVKLVGTPLEIKKRGIRTIKFGNKLVTIPSYRFDSKGQKITNLTLIGKYSNSSKGFGLYYFVEKWEYHYQPTVPLTLYQNWVLEFLGKREALMSLNMLIDSYLIRTEVMTESKAQLQLLKDGLVEDIKVLLENYPSCND